VPPRQRDIAFRQDFAFAPDPLNLAVGAIWTILVPDTLLGGFLVDFKAKVPPALLAVSPESRTPVYERR